MRWFWQRQKIKSVDGKLSNTRLVVFDVEATGLNPRKDKPIAVAAVAIQNGSIPLADQFSTSIRSEQLSEPQAALAHRLDHGNLIEAPDARAVFERFQRYVNGSPSLAYHSVFDDQMLTRAYKRSGMNEQWQRSLDIAHWVLWLHPELGPQPPTLDQALAFCRIHTAGRRRHDALVDSMLTAQLVLALLPKTYQRGVSTWNELSKHISVANKLRQTKGVSG